MTKTTYTLIAATMVLLVSMSHAQEHLLPLMNNPTKDQHQVTATLPDKSGDILLTLPFWDDFSNRGPYPDQGMWADRDVFVNSSFAVHPKTIGVATFDALDQYGLLYEHLTATNTPQVADLLTSHAIRLDSAFTPASRPLEPADGVVLSFYYQPQGRGGNPTLQDSLVLEFLHTPGYFTLDEEGEVIYVEDYWKSVWQAEGETLSAFSNDTFPYFRRVAIPITDPVYFRDDFRFRFKNHVSYPLQGNPTLQNNTGDRTIWNIDYVYLNSGRDPEQTNYFDIAFAAPAQSILARYSAMPWSHYIVNPQAHLRANFSLAITNLDQTIYPYSYRYFIQDETGHILRNYSGGTWNIAPFSTNGYQQYQPHANPIVVANPLPTAPASERHFDIVHTIRAGIAGDDRVRNDTVVYRQSFRNYFAYDDGVPEAGYGVTGRFPRTAKRYIAARQDQLTSIDIYFNQTLGESNANRLFKLTVWKRLAPSEEILYQSEEAFTTELGEEMNRFLRYDLSRAVEVTDTFYIGIEQQGNVSINEFLSIGFDLNNNAGNQLFYNSGAEWMQSIYSGALMIRPVFGTLKSGEEEAAPPAEKVSTTSVYPNPVSGTQMTIQVDHHDPDDPPVRMDIFDAYGRLVYSGSYQPHFGTAHLANGLYFIRMIHPGARRPETTPFIIAR